jgi:hypothetical protein
MRKILITICGIIIFFNANSQLIKNSELISVNGGQGFSNNFHWMFSIGEPIVNTGISGNYILTQGFLQPDGLQIIPLLPFVRNLRIVPNPANVNSNVSFYLTGDNIEYTVKLFTITGQLLRQEIIYSNAGQLMYPLNIENISAGIYMVEVSCLTERYGSKLIIQR